MLLARKMSAPKFNPSYIGSRPDVEALIPRTVKSVLDVGCSNGVLGESIKRHTGATVFGLELSPEMGEEARQRIDDVRIGDAQALLESKAFGNTRFDAIIFADVLEHVADPWYVLKLATERLTPGGVVVSSLPNIRHIDTIYQLVVKGRWPYRERGIHDRTHLRFFTRVNLEEMFEGAGLKIDVMETNYRLVEKPHRINRHAATVARIPGIKPFLAFQYLTRCSLRISRQPAVDE